MNIQLPSAPRFLSNSKDSQGGNAVLLTASHIEKSDGFYKLLPKIQKPALVVEGQNKSKLFST